ncbi:AAA family ATPase [Streptomyces sp. NPDC049040]|uniref:AAA family ATPase n=1 Tax=Streptomyces sp. NPDC049040 TaxID=3365593 RepID=UPI00371E0B9A
MALSADSSFPVVSGADGPRVVRPRGVLDLRCEPGAVELEYGAGAVVVVTGLPGAGKSTLMARAAQAAALADSQAVRERWAARVPGWLAYAVYRPLVRIEHYARLRAAMRRAEPLVVHDSGSQAWVRGWLARAGRRRRRPLHLITLAVTEPEAIAGQQARGRRVTPYALGRHVRAFRSLEAQLAKSAAPPPGYASVVLLDRSCVARLRTIRFIPAPPQPLGRAGPDRHEADRHDDPR